eukprot:scaffold5869_cov165-Amphora_coffeaeformis.AAC.2
MTTSSHIPDGHHDTGRKTRDLVMLIAQVLQQHAYVKVQECLDIIIQGGDGWETERDEFLLNFKQENWALVPLGSIKIFVERYGVKLNAVGNTREPPLLAAIQANRPELVHWMVCKGQADPFLTSPIGHMNALHFASRLGYPACVFALLPFYANNLEIPSGSGHTALHWTTLLLDNPTEKLQCAGLLLQAGADVNALDRNGRTPLHHALFVDMACLLVEEHRADMEVADTKHGLTPLHFYVYMRRRLPLIQYLTEHGANTHTIDNHGFSLIQTMITEPNWETTKSYVSFLLKSKQKAALYLNKIGQNGRTPVHDIICRTRDNELGRLDTILSFEPTLRLPCQSHKWTALHYATMMGQPRLVETILRREDVDRCDSRGRTPLHLASLPIEFTSETIRASGKFPANFDVASWLVEHGHEIPVGDWYTLIERLAKEAGMSIRPSRRMDKANLLERRPSREWGENSAAKVLLQAGANVTLPDKDGNLPFFLSAILRQMDTTFIMLQVGAFQGLFQPSR